MTTAQPDKLVVTQEARRFAAEFFPEGLWQQAARDDVAQAFQRAMNQAAADEREACAKVAEEYADVNGEICFDNVLMDPLLHGEPFTSENVARSDDCGINSTIHSAQSHAGYHIATAIRERTI